MKPFKLPARLWQTLLLILTAAAFSPLSVFAAEAGEEAYTPPFMQPHGRCCLPSSRLVLR